MGWEKFSVILVCERSTWWETLPWNSVEQPVKLRCTQTNRNAKHSAFIFSFLLRFSYFKRLITEHLWCPGITLVAFTCPLKAGQVTWGRSLINLSGNISGKSVTSSSLMQNTKAKAMWRGEETSGGNGATKATSHVRNVQELETSFRELARNFTNANLLLGHSLKTSGFHLSDGLLSNAILSPWRAVMIFPDEKQANPRVLFLSLNSMHKECLRFSLQGPSTCCFYIWRFSRFVHMWDAALWGHFWCCLTCSLTLLIKSRAHLRSLS